MEPNKNMIPVTKTFLPDLNDYMKKVERIWMSGWLTNEGQLEHELSESLKKYLQIPNIQLVSNGTLALQLAIKALGLKGEIITTPYSYVATANAIVWEGCEPRFVDINERSLCIDPNLIESAINDKTSAILATHVYGYGCDVDKIGEIARKHNLKVIYDAAHCFAEKLHGKPIVLHGDISILSFHATKLFHTAEGGGVICQDEDVSDQVYKLKRFGHLGEDDYSVVGINAKLSELHAAMGLCMLSLVDMIIEKRRQIISLYDEKLQNLDLQRPLVTPGLEYNNNYYPILFSTHNQMKIVRKNLFDHQIFPRRYFYPSLNTLPYLQQVGYQPCPVSESAAMRVLSLPVFHELEEDSVARIVDIIIKSL